MEESENQLVDTLDDSAESGDNMIIVASSEDNKQDDEEESPLEDESNQEELADDVNDAKENDDNVGAESSVVETVEKDAPKPVQKKTKKKNKEEAGILDLVVSAFTGDDDEETEATKTEVVTIPRYFFILDIAIMAIFNWNL